MANASLVVGIGCTRGAPTELMERGLRSLLAAHALAFDAVRALATIEHKRDEPGLCALAARHGWPLALYSVQQLAAASGQGGSERVRARVGTPAVAEAAALVRAGTDALLVPRTIYREEPEGACVTLAVARMRMGRVTMAERTIPRLLVAGVSSNVGKTTVTVALARALRARGLRVAMFKCGPDYLDPTYHRRASGLPSHNLDGWMMGEHAVRATFLEATRDADIALIEGVMGLYDGASPTSIEGSSAEIARWLDAPVLLVLDAAGMARSVAALAHGFATFEPGVRVAGLFCNRVGSASHLALLKQACPEPPVLGGMLAATTQRFPSRHLGLHAADQAVTDDDLDVWATRLAEHTDVARILAVAESAPPLAAPAAPATRPSARCRIGVAQDEAFSFYYPYNLRLLEQLGAELVPFSPLRDAVLPDVDGLYVGGGYPELYAVRLSENRALHAALRALAARGRPIYAECGGLMFLSEGIVTLDGVRHAMAGLVPGTAIMQPRLAALGYVEVTTAASSILGPAGLAFRGHQFRYSQLEGSGGPTRYQVRTRRTGKVADEGYGEGSVLASYVHAHWASNPAVAEGFVNACAG